jgi:uncharacterized membrane protein YgcG
MACTLHNVTYYHRLMSDIRVAIEAGQYSDFAQQFDETYVRQDRERRREAWVPGMFHRFDVGATTHLPDTKAPATREPVSELEPEGGTSRSSASKSRSSGRGGGKSRGGRGRR